MSVPNQRIITIHTIKPQKDFLQIRKDVLYNAFEVLDHSYAALYLYLYLSANASGFNLEFSTQAVNNQAHMPVTTCRDQFKKLVEKGFLVQRGTSNKYDFYQTPFNNGLNEEETHGFRF